MTPGLRPFWRSGNVQLVTGAFTLSVAMWQSKDVSSSFVQVDPFCTSNTDVPDMVFIAPPSMAKHSMFSQSVTPFVLLVSGALKVSFNFSKLSRFLLGGKFAAFRRLSATGGQFLATNPATAEIQIFFHRCSGVPERSNPQQSSLRDDKRPSGELGVQVLGALGACSLCSLSIACFCPLGVAS